MDLAKSIISDCFTRQDALSGLLDLQHTAQEHFFNQEKLSVEQGKLLAGIDKNSMDKAFSLAKQKIEEVESLVLYAAVEMPMAEMIKLGKAARKTFGKNLFLDFKVDPALLGGAALAWRGEYRDYSLKAKFEEKKEALLKIYQNSLSN